MCYFSKFEKVSPLIVQNIKTTLRLFDQIFQYYFRILEHNVWWYSCKWKQSKGKSLCPRLRRRHLPCCSVIIVPFPNIKHNGCTILYLLSLHWQRPKMPPLRLLFLWRSLSLSAWCPGWLFSSSSWPLAITMKRNLFAIAQI